MVSSISSLIRLLPFVLQKFGLIILQNAVFAGTLDTWVWLATDLLFTVHPAASDRTGHETSGK